MCGPEYEVGIIPARAGFTERRTRNPQACKDHPRSRGVYSRRRNLERCRSGIIPARAGFTPSNSSARIAAWDHPRSRGVYWNGSITRRGPGGSSPLARGLRHPRSAPFASRRIIPARAGFTRFHTPPGLPPVDHPRSRGVYAWGRFSDSVGTGSSPLARGLRRLRRVGSDLGGIIPARAGFTTHTFPAGILNWDHPRSRGVYSSIRLKGNSLLGSSPLARGLPQFGPSKPRGARIIPARAGFTVLAEAYSMFEEDHPRSRGVYFGSAWSASSVGGSSPLARGLRARRRPEEPARGDHPRSRGVYNLEQAAMRAEERIIPARAGFTRLPRRPRILNQDHPRSRGVYCIGSLWIIVWRGSSPLARGLRGGRLGLARNRGIIPARAGFTSSLFSSCRCHRDHPRSRGVY